ncbi:MAG: hypothetical protein AB1791_06795 [Chloroflexota bacterium]
MPLKNNSHNEWLDGSLYPDVEPPDTLSGVDEQVDFLARLCAAWDFGVLPRWETIEEIRHDKWRAAVDSCRLLTSPTYHLLREWHHLEPLPYLGQQLAYIRDDPYLAYV